MVVVRLARIPTITQEASLMLHAAMLIKLIVVVEALAAKGTQRMSLEASLVRCARLIVAALHVLVELLFCKQLVLVGKDALVSRAQVTHALLMGSLDMAMEIRPAQAGKVARRIGAVVA